MGVVSAKFHTYVNERPLEVSRAVAEAFTLASRRSSEIRWASPLQASKYSEFQDISFLEAIGAKHLAPELKKFWPYRGPCWDALACLEGGGCVIVEAKSHVSEMYGNGCQATGDSLTLIQDSLARTKHWLTVKSDADWLGPLYQLANGLAHLYFLREIRKVEAFLANVYFVGDPHGDFSTTREQWEVGIKETMKLLGINKEVSHCRSVFLKAI
jgi:hypothetical protein